MRKSTREHQRHPALLGAALGAIAAVLQMAVADGASEARAIGAITHGRAAQVQIPAVEVIPAIAVAARHDPLPSATAADPFSGFGASAEPYAGSGTARNPMWDRRAAAARSNDRVKPVLHPGAVISAVAQLVSGTACAQQKLDEFSIRPNPWLGKFDEEARALQQQEQAIRSKVLEAAGGDKQASPVEEAARFTRDVKPVLQPPATLTAEVLESAAAVADMTKTIDYAPYEKAAQEILNRLNDPSRPEGLYGMLLLLLEMHPEIEVVMPDARERLDELFGRADASLAKAIVKPRTRTYVFVSLSQGENALKRLFSSTKGRDDVQYVLRGVPDKMTFAEGLKYVQMLSLGIDPAPMVVIDPTLFKTFGITRVPATVVAHPPERTVVFEKGRAGRRTPTLVAKASGLASDEWVREQIELGHEGDLGVRGETWEIAEPDLLEKMREKIASIDWEAKKRAAIDNFWQRRQFDNVVPTAETDRTREIDPTITVKDDIRDLAGNYLRRKGERINPLDLRPFTKTMLIFNAASRVELDRVEAFLSGMKDKGLPRPILIATKIDASRGWEGYTDITDRLDAHLNIITPEIRERWRIERTPAFVWADNAAKRFYVREIASPDAGRLVPVINVAPAGAANKNAVSGDGR